MSREYVLSFSVLRSEFHEYSNILEEEEPPPQKYWGGGGAPAMSHHIVMVVIENADLFVIITTQLASSL